MKMLAIAGCAALLASCSPRAHAPAPSTPVSTLGAVQPSPAAPPVTSAIRLRLPTLKGGTVSTVVHLPPNLRVDTKGEVLQAKMLWHITLPPSPSGNYAAPQLTAADDSIFVSTGTNIERIGFQTGRVIWRSHKAATPFAVNPRIVAAAHGNTVTALDERDGTLLWRRPVCPASTRVAAVAADGLTAFALCASPAKLVALGIRNGRVRYAHALSNSDRGISLKPLGWGALLADGFFQGAWMGDNVYLVREQTGAVVLKRSNIQLLSVRGTRATFNDRCCFITNYAPAKILPVDLITGETGPEHVLAPDPRRFRNADGEGSYGPDGTLFTDRHFLYLFYGDTLFRYSHLNAAPTELLRGIDRIISARPDALLAVLDGDPQPVLARVDWTARHPAMQPIAATDDNLEGVPLLVSSQGNVLRLPTDCAASGTAPAINAQIIATICKSGPHVGSVEAFSTEP